jgi:hypothetical protein
MLDFIIKSLKMDDYPSNKEETQDFLYDKKIFNLNVENIFRSYGIPRLDVSFKDALRASIIDNNIPEEKRELRGFIDEIGIIRLLNPTLTDYTLFAGKKFETITPESIQKFLSIGTFLGHKPSESNYIKDITVKKAMSDPSDLLEICEQKKLLIEINGAYKMAEGGWNVEKLEISGKSPEPILNKVYGTFKGAIPFFLKLIPKT